MTNRVELIPGADANKTFLYVNNKCVSVAALIAMGDAATTVDASGCTRLTTLDLPAATTVYARGCTELTSYIYGGTDIRGYHFVSLILRNERRVFAGCRNFSIRKARQHWENNAECLALVENIVAEAARRGENNAA